MGQIADDMLSGFQCSWCGICFNHEHGHPVLCADCFNDDPVTARQSGLTKAEHSEIGSDEPADEVPIFDRPDRIQNSSAAFVGASEIVSQHGMKLVQRTINHYQLSHVTDRWLLNLYPGNRRIFADLKRPKAPYLDFAGKEWNVLDVVKAAIQHTNGVLK